MSRLNRVLGVLAVVFLAAATAGESRADPAEAERIRGAIDVALGSLQWPWKAGGEITVNEVGGAYHVIIPDVTLDPGQEFEGQSEGILDFGDVSIIAKPLADDRYHIDVTVANRMSFREPGGALVALITIGKQRFEGVWVPAFQTFIEADAAYEDIWLTGPGSQSMLTLSELTMRVAMEENASGSWSGPSATKFSQLRFEVPESGERFGIGEFEVRAYVDAMRLGDWSRFVREMTGMMEQLQAQTGAAEPDPAALLALLTDMPRLFASAWSDMTISNVTAQDAGGTRVFGMDRMAMYFGVNGVDQDRASAQFRYEHSGLDVAALEGVTRLAVPGDVTLEIEAVDLPTQALWEGIIEVIKSSAEMPPELIQMMLLQRVTEAVFAASSGLNITKLNFDAPGIDITGTGAIKADGASMHGVTGQFDATVRGIDNMIAAISDAPQDENTMQIAMALSLMQALGATEPDEDGVSVRRYVLSIGADGQVLLNGNDLQAMLGLMGTPSAAVAESTEETDSAVAGAGAEDVGTETADVEDVGTETAGRLSAEGIGEAIAELYGVEVLRVVPAQTDDGHAAWRVTFMNPGGDFNEAFQVNTILVDAETGKPIVQFRHLPSGTRNADAATYDTSQQGLDVLSAGAVRR